MKKRWTVMLVVLLMLALFAGCGWMGLNGNHPEELEMIYVVPDSTLEEDEYNPKIYGIDPAAPVVEIPEEEVPLASAYVDVTDGVSEREAEAIAIHYAGLSNDENVSFLHSRYVAEEAPFYYNVEFRSGNVPYRFWISAANGEILLFEKGE